MERAITKQFSKSAYVLMAPFLRPILKKAALTQLELWALAILREIVVAYAVHYRADGTRWSHSNCSSPLQDFDRNRSKRSCTYVSWTTCPTRFSDLPPALYYCLSGLATGRIKIFFFFYYIFLLFVSCWFSYVIYPQYKCTFFKYK